MVKRFFNLLFKLIFSFILISVVWVIVYKFIPIPFTATMIVNSIENIGTDAPVLWNKKWVPYSEISDQYKRAVIASEDQKFYDHNGFDLESIQKAFKHNEKNASKIRGGSTISQQTAKNAFLWQGRSWLRKGLEAYFTLLIELIWGKERILEVYLNIAEMGNGVYGVGAASEKYFNTSASQVSKLQAASIAAILPSPKKYSVTHPGPFMQKRKNWIMRQMNNVLLEKSGD